MPHLYSVDRRYEYLNDNMTTNTEQSDDHSPIEDLKILLADARSIIFYRPCPPLLAFSRLVIIAVQERTQNLACTNTDKSYALLATSSYS